MMANARAYFLVLLFIYLGLKVLLDREGGQPVIGAYPVRGIASWYSGSATASGETHDDAALTCALRRKDFGRFYRVCNTANGRCVVVRHNNFGPRRDLFHQGRIIDLSKAAFSQISELGQGLVQVTVTPQP